MLSGRLSKCEPSCPETRIWPAASPKSREHQLATTQHPVTFSTTCDITCRGITCPRNFNPAFRLSRRLKPSCPGGPVCARQVRSGKRPVPQEQADDIAEGECDSHEHRNLSM